DPAAAGRGHGDAAGDRVLAVGPWMRFASGDVPAGVVLVQTSGYARPGLGAARYALDRDQAERAPTRFRRRSANGRWFHIAEPAIGYTMAGAVGDGTGEIRRDGTVVPDAGTDDTAAIQALYDHLAASGEGGGVALVEPRQFNVSTIEMTGSDIRTIGLGEASHVHTVTRTGRPSAFVAFGTSATRRLARLGWENMRISGGAAWGNSPFESNGVLCGYGVRTRWADDVEVARCFVDHLSDSGVSIRDGLRPQVRGNRVHHVAQGIDIFFNCVDGRVIGNIVTEVKVVAAINVEGRTSIGYPRGTLVSGNTVDGAVTSGIDIIEARDTVVAGNDVSNVSGGHPGFPGYSFGIQLFGSPATRVAGNRIEDIRGAASRDGRTQPTGLGICVAANSGDSIIVGNISRRCSRAACGVNDTQGTSPTNNVLIEGNTFDTDVVLEGNVSLRPLERR
uniref:right-handed parallel beta-helix repeat-containing protein n=1 Tax=Sphingomonas bacterium TaxID=1895847 RepID=UPI001C2D3EF7